MLTDLPITKDLLMHVARETCSQHTTLGQLFIDGDFKWWTLEDALHDGPKIPGQTCIPAGRYEVIINWSVRFKRLMPLLLNVPGFTGVRIHVGNTNENTDGCILVGGAAQVAKGVEPVILHSIPAFEDVFQIIQHTIASGFKVFIEVVNPIVVPKDPAGWTRPIIQSA